MLREDKNDMMAFMENLKEKIISSQKERIYSINREIIMIYWEMGNLILIKKNEGFETEFISSLVNYLRINFPNMQYFTEKNLKYTSRFAEEYRDRDFVDKILSQVSWSHNIVLMDKINDINKRIDYINKILENGWSKEELLSQIEIDHGMGEINDEDYNLGNNHIDDSLENEHVEEENILHSDSNYISIKDIEIEENNNEYAYNIANIKNKVSEGSFNSSLQVIKDVYMIDFMNLSSEVYEEKLENQFITSTIEFFLELNSGFALVGKKHHIELAGGDYYIDLVFYNLNLKCYVAVELKVGNFKPEYLGILTFHLSIIDDALKKKEDNSAIGIILCKDDEKLIVQYAFRDLGDSEDAEYRLSEDIPKQFKTSLPTVKEIGYGIKRKLKSY